MTDLYNTMSRLRCVFTRTYWRESICVQTFVRFHNFVVGQPCKTVPKIFPEIGRLFSNCPLACSSLIIIARLILFMSVCAGGSWRPRVVPVPWARDLIHAQPLNRSSKWCGLETWRRMGNLMPFETRRWKCKLCQRKLVCQPVVGGFFGGCPALGGRRLSSGKPPLLTPVLPFKHTARATMTVPYSATVLIAWHYID